MKKIFLIIFLFVLNFENPGFAHGVGFREISLKSVPLEFFYSTGEKMSYCEAKIFSPKDSKFAAQTSRTDEQGRISFIPDSIGEWRVIVNDGQGHQCEAKINVTEEFLKIPDLLTAWASGKFLLKAYRLNFFIRQARK